jgi:hypothetical protein
MDQKLEAFSPQLSKLYEYSHWRQPKNAGRIDDTATRMTSTSHHNPL